MRDFRDAKAMAYSLRDALQAKAVQTTHSECLELIAKAFGYDNWNILSAKIEAVRVPERRASASAPDATQKTLYCSFCGKSQHQVRALIAGPAVFVCDECVGLCDDILADRDIWELLKADEEGGHHAHTAALNWLHGKSAEEVSAFVERGRRGVERQRLHLRNVQRVLATRAGEAAATEELASPGLAHLNSRTTDELVAIEQHAQRDLKRYEEMIRIGTTVLEGQ